MTAAPDGDDRGRGCRSTLLRLASAALLLVVVLAGCGLLYEARAEQAVAERLPPPGRLVEVAGRTMHIHCTGSGSPTVLLDAGQGGWSSDWGDLMAALPPEPQVCAYDRAGYGWSAPAADARSPGDAAADLAALLDAAEIPPPYLLVAFSHAGLAARLFAARHAEQMAGLVLVDPATEFDAQIMGPELLRQQQTGVGALQFFGFLARLGVVRLMGPENMAPTMPFIATDPAAPKIYYPLVADPRWWETSRREFTSRLDESLLAQVGAEGTIPAIPLIVITAGDLDAAAGESSAAVEAARQVVLRDLAAQSPSGSFVVAEGSTHAELPGRVDLLRPAIEAIVDQSR